MAEGEGSPSTSTSTSTSPSPSTSTSTSPSTRLWSRLWSRLRPAAQTPSAPPSTPLTVFVLLGVVFVYVFVISAWVVDDAYITFRSVDNFVRGEGLTWNVGERVQVYTHPLWMFLMSIVYYLTDELFFTCLAISLALGLLLLWWCRRALRDYPWWAFPLLFALLMASKAFMDFVSSGLENPLSHLLIALFYTAFLTRPTSWADATPRELVRMTVLAALAFVTRQDTLLMYLPAVGYLLVLHVRRLRWRTLRLAALGLSPAIAWLGFSLFYYGSPYPNTAYAKALTTGVSRSQYLKQGSVYLMNSLQWDPPTLIVIILAVALAIASRARTAVVTAGGIALYILYITVIGASGSNMSGRFLTPVYLMAALLLVHVIARVQPDQRAQLAIAALTGFFILFAPASPLKGSYTALGKNGTGKSFIIDTRFLATREGAAPSQFARSTKPPNHAWYRAGLAFHDKPATVQVGGANGVGAMGYFGFAVGPRKYVIDPLGLCDPLLSRIPMKFPRLWNPGHFPRELPPGYKRSLEQGKNLIEDPDLHTYYDKVRIITRGPLLSWTRIKTIVAMNLGAYDGLVDSYIKRVRDKAKPIKVP